MQQETNHSRILGHILLVDDDQSVRSVLRHMISTLPVQLTEAADGHTALDYIAKQTFDVIISDLVMPKMSGLMLLHIMIEKGIQIPFILLTGYSDKDSAIQALRLGVFDYLEKPIHEEDLRSVVEEALRVSQDQKLILSTANGEGISAVHRFDPRAKSLILKMRAFSLSSKNVPTPPDVKMNWAALRDLFIEESIQLLKSSYGTFEQWNQSNQKVLDLGYGLRIVQSIRFAANAINLAHIADLAWHCETAIATLKLAPDYINSENIRVIVQGIRLIEQHIENLKKDDDLEALQKLDQLQSKLNQAS